MKYRIIGSVLIVGSTGMAIAGSLQAKAEQFILEHEELHDQVKEMPISVRRGLGRRYCLNRRDDSWKKLTQEYTFLSNSDEKVRGISFLADTSIAVSVSHNGKLRWFETDGYPHLFYEISTEQGNVTGFSVSGDGNIIATASDRTVKLWNSRTRDCIHSIDHDEKVYSVAVYSSYLIVGGAKGKVWLWDLSDGSVRLRCAVVHKRLPRTPSLNKIRAVQVLNDGEHFVSVMQRSIKLWNISTGECIKELHVDCKARIWSIHFIDNSCLFYSFTDGTSIKIDVLSEVNEKHKKDLGDKRSLHQKAVFSDDLKYMVTGGLKEPISLWKISDKIDEPYELLLKCPGEGIIAQIAFSKDGLGFFSGDSSGLLRYWSFDRAINMPLEDAKQVLSEES